MDEYPRAQTISASTSPAATSRSAGHESTTPADAESVSSYQHSSSNSTCIPPSHVWVAPLGLRLTIAAHSPGTRHLVPARYYGRHAAGLLRCDSRSPRAAPSRHPMTNEGRDAPHTRPGFAKSRVALPLGHFYRRWCNTPAACMPLGKQEWCCSATHVGMHTAAQPSHPNRENHGRDEAGTTGLTSPVPVSLAAAGGRNALCAAGRSTAF